MAIRPTILARQMRRDLTVETRCTAHPDRVVCHAPSDHTLLRSNDPTFCRLNYDSVTLLHLGPVSSCVRCVLVARLTRLGPPRGRRRARAQRDQSPAACRVRGDGVAPHRRDTVGPDGFALGLALRSFSSIPERSERDLLSHYPGQESVSDVLRAFLLCSHSSSCARLKPLFVLVSHPCSTYDLARLTLVSHALGSALGYSSSMLDPPLSFLTARPPCSAVGLTTRPRPSPQRTAHPADSLPHPQRAYSLVYPRRPPRPARPPR